MSKRDKVFYAGCVLFVIGVVLTIMDYDIALLFLVGSYLLRPLLHAIGLGKKYGDERQIQIFSRSGNIAFLVMIFGATILAILRMSQGEPPGDFYLLIFFGLVTKAIVGLLMIGDFRRAGVIMLISFGTIMGVFASLYGVDEIKAGETPWETIVGVSLIIVSVIVGLLARKHPRLVAVLLMLIAVGFIYKLSLWEFTEKDNGVWLFIVLPLALITACLWGKPDTTDTFTDSEFASQEQ